MALHFFVAAKLFYRNSIVNLATFTFWLANSYQKLTRTLPPSPA